MSERKEHQKTKVNYGYYIDEDGLFYYSEIDGEVYQCLTLMG